MNVLPQTSGAEPSDEPTAAPVHGHHPIHWAAEAIHHLFDHHPDEEDRHRYDIHRHYDFMESAEMSREAGRL